jgi:cathepsin L
MNDEQVETRRRLTLQSCYPFAGWGSNKPTTFVSFQNYSQPIKNQGACGSCAIFAGVAQYELNYYLYKGVCQSQSEQYILDCAGDDVANCQGGWSSNVNKWLGTYGSCPSSCYDDYDGKDTWSCSLCSCHKTPISKTACITSTSTGGYLGTSLEYWNIIANTAQYVGLSYVQQISNNFYYLSSTNPYLYECDINNILGSRAMTIYGEYYGNWLLIKNSYGVNWGNQGWFWLNINARTTCMSKYPDTSFNYW